MGLLGHFRSMGAMLLENSRWRKLSKLVTHHVFRHKDGIKYLAVMDQKSMAHEVGRNRRAARPRLDRLLHRRSMHFLNLLEEMTVDKRTFFEGTTHSLLRID